MKKRVGIDIGSYNIKLIELEDKTSTLTLTKCATKHIVNKDIKRLLKDLISQSRFSIKNVNVSMAGPSVIVRYIEMPPMKLARYRKWVEPLVDEMFSDFQMKVLETIAQENRVMVEVQSSAKAKDGRDYGMEYRISFIFDDKGRITKVKEYVDSLYTARFYGLINEVK